MTLFFARTPIVLSQPVIPALPHDVFAARADSWRDTRLIDEAGNQRPAYKVWKAWFDLPLEPVKKR